jgi:hypothetical protein
MINISIQVRNGTSSLRTMIRAESIQRAIGIASIRYPDSEVRVLFPIDPETFFEREPDLEVGAIWLEMPEEATG